MTAALEGGEWSVARPGRNLPPVKSRYPFYRKLGGPQGRSGRAENLVPTGIRSRPVQPVAQSLYRLSYPAHNNNNNNTVSYTYKVHFLVVESQFTTISECLKRYFLNNLLWPQTQCCLLCPQNFLAGEQVARSVNIPSWYFFISFQPGSVEYHLHASWRQVAAQLSRLLLRLQARNGNLIPIDLLSTLEFDINIAWSPVRSKF